MGSNPHTIIKNMKGLKSILLSKSNTEFEVKGNGNELCELYEVVEGRCNYVGTYTKSYLKKVWDEVYGYKVTIKD